MLYVPSYSHALTSHLAILGKKLKMRAQQIRQGKSINLKLIRRGKDTQVRISFDFSPGDMLATLRACTQIIM